MRITDDAKKKAISDRLARLGGQVNGIREMIEREEDCTKIATQLSAVKSALGQTVATFTMCVFDEAEHPHDASKRDSDSLARVVKLIS